MRAFLVSPRALVGFVLILRNGWFYIRDITFIQELGIMFMNVVFIACLADQDADITFLVAGHDGKLVFGVIGSSRTPVVLLVGRAQ